ncbi:MAG TPA: serine protease [Thermoanaerobaculia bacterium]|nr:serine protease [Thermoanaerobaculia bacterium]
MTLVTEIGRRARFAKSFSTDHEVESVPPVAQPHARYIRIRVEARDFEGCPWNLTVRDESYRVVQTLTAEDFRNSSKRWTLRIRGAKAFFDLRRCPNGKPFIQFDEYIWMPDNAPEHYYSIQGSTPTYLDLFSDSIDNNLRRFGDSVGMFMASWEEESWVCSGVMVAEDLFLTNWHCGGPQWILDPNDPGQLKPFPENFYWQPPIVKDALVDLSFDGDERSREYIVTGVAARNKYLDYALLEVQPLDAVGKARPVPLRRAFAKANEPILIVHHPEGKTKQITPSCQVADSGFPSWRSDWQESSFTQVCDVEPGNSAAPAADGRVRLAELPADFHSTDFTHFCDTESGSSGAPVFDERGRLVGLHHLGFELDSATCQQKDRRNKAVRIDRILTNLELCHPDVYKKLLIE